MLISMTSAPGLCTSLLHMAWHPRELLRGSMSALPLIRNFSCHCRPRSPSTSSSALLFGPHVTLCFMLIVPSLPYLDRGNCSLTSTPRPSFPPPRHVTKLAGGLLFFLPLPYLVVVITLHYTTLHYFGTIFHYFTLLYITGDIILYSTLHMCALWWQVVISLSRLLCGIQPLWLCGPYHDLLCVWELLSCHSLSVRTVVTPFSIMWESSMTCAVRTLCFLAAALSNSMCALLYTTLFSTLAAAILFTLCVPYSTLPYSLLYSMGAYSTRPYSWLRPYSISTPMCRLPDMCIPYTLSI